MKSFSVITKKNCSKCVDLKDWLKESQVQYEEWSVEDKQIVDKLLHNEGFIQTFCDIEGCTVYTPVIHVDGKFYFKELFGID